MDVGCRRTGKHKAEWGWNYEQGFLHAQKRASSCAWEVREGFLEEMAF